MALRRLATRSASALTAVADDRRLVHGDSNPKNLLAARGERGWRVTAVLDWEFAFSGSPLVDVGNLLRVDDEPAGYRPAVLAGFTAAGGSLPAGWPRISRALDLFALADLLTRPVDHPHLDRFLALVRRRLATADR